MSTQIGLNGNGRTRSYCHSSVVCGYYKAHLLGKLLTLGFDLKVEAQLDAVTLEIIKNSEIEGETLNGEQMRSLVARYLGLDSASMPTTTHEIDAVVEMILSATYYYQQPVVR